MFAMFIWQRPISLRSILLAYSPMRCWRIRRRAPWGGSETAPLRLVGGGLFAAMAKGLAPLSPQICRRTPAIAAQYVRVFDVNKAKYAVALSVNALWAVLPHIQGRPD